MLAKRRRETKQSHWGRDGRESKESKERTQAHLEVTQVRQQLHFHHHETNRRDQNLRKYFVLGGSAAAGFFSSLATIAAPDAMDPNAAIPSNSEWNRIVYVWCSVYW